MKFYLKICILLHRLAQSRCPHCSSDKRRETSGTGTAISKQCTLAGEKCKQRDLKIGPDCPGTLGFRPSVAAPLAPNNSPFTEPPARPPEHWPPHGNAINSDHTFEQHKGWVCDWVRRTAILLKSAKRLLQYGVPAQDGGIPDAVHAWPCFGARGAQWWYNARYVKSGRELCAFRK